MFKAGSGKARSVPAHAPASMEGEDAPQPQLTRQEKAEIASHPLDTFASLKGYVDYPIFKALTEKPFNFEKMSAVQEAVLGLLPEIAAPTARGTSPDAAKQETGVTTKEDGTPRRGYRSMPTDLLVKAKTGTGKTLAFLVPALEARVKDLEQEERNFKLANPECVYVTSTSLHAARLT